MRTFIAIAVLLTAAACDEEPNVHPAIVDMVETLKSQRDCSSLQAAFDRTDDVDEMRYIDDAMSDAGCYD